MKLRNDFLIKGYETKLSRTFAAANYVASGTSIVHTNAMHSIHIYFTRLRQKIGGLQRSRKKSMVKPLHAQNENK